MNDRNPILHNLCRDAQDILEPVDHEDYGGFEHSPRGGIMNAPDKRIYARMIEMISPKSTRVRKSCLLIALLFLGLCLLAVAASALSNLGLPRHSTTVVQLSALEKARLSEVLHLRKTLGETVWPGWSEADIPLMVYNEQYAFLVGMADPPAGWMKVPALEQRGGPWEEVPGDLFEGRPYYRTPITDPEKTPEVLPLWWAPLVGTFKPRI
jgi:hypothetical protein